MTIIKMTEKEILKKHPLTSDMRSKIRALNDADLDLSEMPSPKMLAAMTRPGRPPVPHPKNVISLRLEDSEIRHLRANGKGWQTKLRNYISQGIATGVL